MKTLFTMYVRRNIGVMVLIHSLTFYIPSLFTQKLYKIQINLDKFSRI